MQFVSSVAAIRPVPPQIQSLRMNFGLVRAAPPQLQKTVDVNAYAPSPALSLADTTAAAPPKMEWGAAIWIFFHTLAFKVRDADFTLVRVHLFNFIKGISMSLPCPKCSEHAKTYLASVNFDAVASKRDLILMLYAFHNAVNARKHARIETTEDMDALYARANTVAVVRYFAAVFRAKNGNTRLLTDDMQRRLIADKFEKWFVDNASRFDP